MIYVTDTKGQDTVNTSSFDGDWSNNYSEGELVSGAEVEVRIQE